MNRPWTSYYPEGVNDTISTDQFSSIANYMESAVDKYPSNIAITCMDTDITYSQYNKFANNIANIIPSGNAGFITRINITVIPITIP